MSKVRVASRATRRGRRLRSQLSSSPPEARVAHDSATDLAETGEPAEGERASSPPLSPARADGDRVSGTVPEAADAAAVARGTEGRARIRSRPPAPAFDLSKKHAARPSEPPPAEAARPSEPPPAVTVPDAGAARALEAQDDDEDEESERAAEPPPAPSAPDAAPEDPVAAAASPAHTETATAAGTETGTETGGAVDSLGDTLQSEVLAPAAREARAASTPAPVRTVEAREHHDEAPLSSRSSAALESKLNRLDSEFFRESHAPHAPHHVHDEESVDDRHPPPSPELLARRSRMRRTVGIVVGAIALVVVGALAKASLTSSTEPSASATQPRPKTTQAAPATAALPAPTPTPTAVATAPAPSASDAASADASASAAPDASASTSAATSAEASASASSSASVKELLAETLKLLNMNKLADAAESARRLVAAAPEDATGYLYLGSALQDLGKGPEARAAFDDCMTFAKTGPYGECAMMGGRKRK